MLLLHCQVTYRVPAYIYAHTNKKTSILHFSDIHTHAKTYTLTISIMHVYHYCLYLLAFVVVIIKWVYYCFEFTSHCFNWSSSRYVARAYDDGDDEYYLPNNYHASRGYRPSLLNRYLRNLMAFELNDEKYDDAAPFERRGKAITKGDPREFMG